jgi:hypothetical protein
VEGWERGEIVRTGKIVKGRGYFLLWWGGRGRIGEEIEEGVRKGGGGLWRLVR